MAEGLFYGYASIAAGNRLYLERPRIDRLLEKAAQKPIVSVAAGAGFGKSCAVYSYAKKSKTRTAWIQLTERDNNAEFFWENFISAVSIIGGGMAARARKAKLPASEKQFEEYLEAFERKNILNEDYLFVYDDFHLIADRAVLRFLERRLASIHPNITSILISRKEPPFSLPKKTLARISGEDLKFTRNEMVAYFHLRRLNPGPQTASAIYRAAGGWAFAIHLAGLSLANDSFEWESRIERGDGRGPLSIAAVRSRRIPGAAYVTQALRANIFTFIESEIMAPLSPELRRFLIKISLVENLSPALLREIGNGSARSGEMEKLASFVRFDGRHNVYRVHPAFMAYLRSRQFELTGEEKKGVWTMSARWCAQNGRTLDAISSYEKTGDYGSIIGILDTYPMTLPTRIAEFLLGLLEKAPGNARWDKPIIPAMRSRALISLGRYAQSRAELLEFAPVIESLAERVPPLDDSDRHHILMAYYLCLGFTEFFLSAPAKRCDFLNCFKIAARERKHTNFVVAPPLNGISLGFHVCRVFDPAPGELEKFIAAVDGIVPYTAEILEGCLWGMSELVRGELAFYRGNFCEAEKILLAAAEKSREKDQYEIYNRALFYLLRVYMGRGNGKEIGNVLRKLEAELEQPFYLNRQFQYDIVAGWRYIQTGKGGLAASWLKSDYAESGLNSRGRGLEKLIKAKYLFSEKRYPAAIALLENMENMDGVEIFLMGRVEIKALEAVCRYRLQDKEGACQALNEARALASPAGLFTPFAELGKDMRALTESAIRDKRPELPREWLEEIRRIAAEYAKKLYRQAADSGGENGKGPSLSYRETDILAGLSRGLTREEIAGASSISPNTVKSAVRSIYNKLGARNQADAVRIAAEKGLLPKGG